MTTRNPPSGPLANNIVQPSSPGRFTLAVMLAAAMLAAYGVTWLQASRGAARLAAGRLAVVCLAAAAALAAGLVGANVWLRASPGGARWLIERAYLSMPRDSYSSRSPPRSMGEGLPS